MAAGFGFLYAINAFRKSSYVLKKNIRKGGVLDDKSNMATALLCDYACPNT